MTFSTTLLPAALLLVGTALAAPPTNAPIVGTVVTEDGAPVSGASIVPAGGELDPHRRKILESARVTTDGRGRFELPSALITGAVQSAWVTVVADGRAAASAQASRKARSLRFVLRPELRLPVRVVDEKGAGVPGVRLFVSSAMDRPSTREKPDPQARFIAGGTGVSQFLAPLTDQDGRAVVGHLPRGGQVSLLVKDLQWVQVSAAGEELTPLPLPERAVADELVLRVRPAASIEGRLLTEAGRPLAGYRVSVLSSQVYAFPDIAITDERGTFRVEGLPGGPTGVQVHGPPATDAVLPRLMAVSLGPGEHLRDLRIVCPAGTLVTGRLVDAVTGRPIGGAWIGARERGDCVGAGGAKTDADGSFGFRLLPGRWFLHLRLPYEYDDHTLSVRDPQRFYGVFQAENGRDRPLGDIQVQARRLPSVRGVVIGPDGRPAAGATVYYREADFGADTLEWTRHVTAGPDGRFEIPRLDYTAGGVFLLRANKGSLSTLRDIRIDAKQEPGPQLLRLGKRPLAVLRGRVVDDAGKPVRTATVVVNDRHPPTGSADPPFPRTDAQGRFEIRVWPGDQYCLVAGAANHGYGRGRPFRPHSGVNHCPPLVLQRANSFLEVVAVDEGGKPVPKAVLQFEVPTGRAYTFPTDGRSNSEGRLRVENVLPGEYGVKAYLPDGSRYGEARVGAGQREVRIVLYQRGG